MIEGVGIQCTGENVPSSRCQRVTAALPSAKDVAVDRYLLEMRAVSEAPKILRIYTALAIDEYKGATIFPSPKMLSSQTPLS